MKSWNDKKENMSGQNNQIFSSTVRTPRKVIRNVNDIKSESISNEFYHQPSSGKLVILTGTTPTTLPD